MNLSADNRMTLAPDLNKPTSGILIADATSSFVGPEDRERKRRADILTRFESTQMTDEQCDAIDRIASEFHKAAEFVLNATNPGREQSLALTALQESMGWTTEGIAISGVPA